MMAFFFFFFIELFQAKVIFILYWKRKRTICGRDIHSRHLIMQESLVALHAFK